MIQTEGDISVVSRNDMLENSLGRSPTPDQRGTQDLAGTNSGEALSPRNPRPIRQVKMKDFVVHAYQWFISDWSHSERVASMSLQERGLYREILDILYAQESVSAEESTIIKLTRSEVKEFNKAWPKVKQCLYLDNEGRYRNRRVDVELTEISKHRKKKSDAGKAGNDARWGRSESDGESIADGSQTDRKDIAPLPHPLPHPHSHSHPQSQSPLRPVLADETFAQFEAAYREAKPDVIPEDFSEALYGWRLLSFEQQILAVQGVRKRVEFGQWRPGEPNFIPKPAKYLQGEWKRDILPPVKKISERERKVQAWLAE